MYEPQEVKAVIDHIVSVFKKTDSEYAQRFVSAQNKSNLFAQKKEPMPNYYPCYNMTVDFMERIRIHSELGYFPEKLFEKRSPNQTQQEADYIRENFKQTTLPFFNEYISTVTRAFADPNCGVNFEDEEEKYKAAEITFQNYVESQIKDYGSIENFIQYIIPAIKAQDANGVVVVKPNEIKTQVDEEGNEITDDTQLDTPVPYYFNSKQVVGYEEGIYCVVELHEKSVVDYGNSKYRMGKIYEFYDDINIWRVTQVGKWNDYSFVYEIFYEHQWGKVPATRLKGIPRIYNNEIVWMSPMLYVTDLLDLVLLNSSNLQISINTCVYPYRIMYGQECEFQDKDSGGAFIHCIDGYITDGMGTRKTCPSCGGTGLKSRLSPMGVLLIKPPTTDDRGGDLKTTSKPIEFVSPSVETLDFLVKIIEKHYNKALEILHLKSGQVASKPAGDASGTSAITATEVVSNMKALYAFVRSVSDQTFDLYQFVLDAIGWMRYGTDYKGATVKYPTTFDFANEMDYAIQIGEMSKYNMPPFVIYSVVIKYLKAIYQEDKNAGDAFKLITETDRLLTLSNADIQAKLATGTVEKWEEILHTSAPNFVIELSSTYDPTPEIDNFFAQDMAVQKAKLIEKAKAVAASVQAASPQTALQNVVKDTLLQRRAVA